MTIISSKKAIKKTLIKRAKIKEETPVFSLDTFLFEKQLNFVKDPSPNKVAVCSRRAGKTKACAADLISTAREFEGVVCLYITLSRANAKKIIWRELKKINKDYKLKGEINESELSIYFPDKDSIIYCSGAKDISEIEKFRGLAVKLVYIDEGQSFRAYIRQLIDDVLSPALIDYAGTLCLTGTPGPVPTGYFYECSHSGMWTKHSWTFFDNPFLAEKSKLSHQQMLDRELKRRGVSADDPSIQREWFGKWVLDSDSLLLHYNKDINHYIELPPLPFNKKYNYIMGVDLGFHDADAIAVLAWSELSKETYLVEELVTNKQGISELVQQIQLLLRRYDASKIVMDEGGLGKKIAEEIRRQHHIPVQGADKKLKMQNVAFLNDALRTGRFKAKSGNMFAQDSFLVEIDRDKSKPDKIVVSERYHSDIIDAVLYAFKESPAFTFQEKQKGPPIGSPEWAAAQQTHMFEAEMEGLKKEREHERWLNGIPDEE